MSTTRFLPGILALAFFLPVPSHAEVRLKGRELTNCRLRVSPALVAKAASIEKALTGGLDRLRDMFDRPALVGKPQFWLLSTPAEMDSVLLQFFKLPDARREQAVKSGTYRDAENILIVLDPRTSDDWLLRLLYTEHVRSLLDASAPSSRGLRIGWFYAGTSAYFAWIVAGEQLGHREDRTQRLIMEYYARFFNPDEFLPLQLLEVPADWDGALERKGPSVYAQAVLTVLYLAEKKSSRTPITIIRSYEREEAFSTAFSRGAGMTLKGFEKALIRDLFPEVRRLRGEKNPDSKKEPPGKATDTEKKGGSSDSVDPEEKPE